MVQVRVLVRIIVDSGATQDCGVEWCIMYAGWRGPLLGLCRAVHLLNCLPEPAAVLLQTDACEHRQRNCLCGVTHVKRYDDR